ncbi:CPCC family cysteine-rich protein [Desulfobacula toluolica]|uniref:Conserved uncharacterized protein n=1 Tax=Desulfobacula toluolica (strain DSM 7467 / Tol2) TaxID=651182 RepID=K0NDD2_DESTT|nr:CPCC family cysteine-rich protein [Desulfobacula toluolica]CCK78790.1 conserved uncharacterized protein [Desulfobacula toluolica Tol2]
MKRQKALSIVVKNELNNLDQFQRKLVLKAQLETIKTPQWFITDEWKSVPLWLQKQFKLGHMARGITYNQYNLIISVWLHDRLKAVSNDYLLKYLKNINIQTNCIEGNPPLLQSCPCCGYKTLSSLGNYDICIVCKWENNGYDNTYGIDDMNNPNHSSLMESRFFF